MQPTSSPNPPLPCQIEILVQISTCFASANTSVWTLEGSGLLPNTALLCYVHFWSSKSLLLRLYISINHKSCSVLQMLSPYWTGLYHPMRDATMVTTWMFYIQCIISKNRFFLIWNMDLYLLMTMPNRPVTKTWKAVRCLILHENHRPGDPWEKMKKKKKKTNAVMNRCEKF